MPIEYLMFMPLAVCLGLLAIFLAASALVSLARASCLPRRSRIGWALAIILLPVVGPLSWLGFNQYRDRRSAPRPADSGPTSTAGGSTATGGTSSSAGGSTAPDAVEPARVPQTGRPAAT